MPFLEFCFRLFANHSLVAGFIVISSVEGRTCKPGGSCILLVLVLLGVIVIELDRDDRLLRAEEGRDDDRLSANKQQKQKKLKEEMLTKHTHIHKKQTNKELMNEAVTFLQWTQSSTD